jgi:MinD-like ATPase involved in chromosome partitioning or flagellar assembly
MADLPLNPNEESAQAVVAAAVDALRNLGYDAVVVVINLGPGADYHWSASMMPKDAVVLVLKSEAAAIERDLTYRKSIAVHSA